MDSLSRRRKIPGLSVIAPNRAIPSPLLSGLSTFSLETPLGRDFSGFKNVSGRETPLLFMNEMPENEPVIRPVIKPIGRKIKNKPLHKNNIIQFIAKKNTSNNQNFSVQLYDEFKSDIFNDENNIIVYDLSNPEEENIPRIISRFAKMYLIKINTEYKYIVKKILKAYNPETEQINVEVEVNNIKFINQNIRELPFMLESIVLRNNKNNGENNVYIITKYLQNYMSLKKYLQNIKRNISTNIDLLKHILSQLNIFFEIMNNVGILHNDLDQHLNNIMINPETLDIKLIDYGLCLLKSESEFNKKLLYQKNMVLLLILNELFEFSRNKRNLIFRLSNIKSILEEYFSCRVSKELYNIYYQNQNQN